MLHKMLCKMLRENGHVGKQKPPTLLEHVRYARVGVKNICPDHLAGRNQASSFFFFMVNFNFIVYLFIYFFFFNLI